MMGGPRDTLTLHNDGVLVKRRRQLRRDLRRRRGPLEREREGPLPSACSPVRPHRVPPVQAVRPVVVVPLEHGLPRAPRRRAPQPRRVGPGGALPDHPQRALQGAQHVPRRRPPRGLGAQAGLGDDRHRPHLLLVVLVDDEQRVDDARLVATVDLAQRVRQPLLGGGVVRPADAEVAGHQLQQHLAKAQDVVGTSGRWTCHAKVVLELIRGHCIFLNKGLCSFR